MRISRVVPFALVLALSAGACQRQVAQAVTPAPSIPTPAATVPQLAAPFATPPVLAGTPDVATLVAKVKPAVVNITTVHEIKAPSSEFELPFGLDPFGGGPFGRRQPRGGDRVQRQQALGSGFLVDAEGHVVTNAHVVEGADEVKVRLADDREFEAKVKGRDARLDVAVLELQGAKDLPATSLGSSEGLRVGEYVVAIGNPFGLGHTVTMGIVSAKGRTIGAGPYDDFIQTDASINPGNSGGPLFNLTGQVVGINTAINPNGKGIGFAIPVDMLKEVLPQLMSTGHVARGRLGVLVQPVDNALAKALGLDRPKGALVGEVEAGGPAEKAGLKAGDLIVSVDDREVPRSEDLPRIVAHHPPGTKVSLKVLRERALRALDVTLTQLKDDPDDPTDPGAGPGEHAPGGLGVRVREAPGGGALVEGVQPGAAAEGQLERGDVIVEVNQHPVGRAAELPALVQATPKGQPVLLKVKRGGKSRYVAIERK